MSDMWSDFAYQASMLVWVLRIADDSMTTVPGSLNPKPLSQVASICTMFAEPFATADLGKLRMQRHISQRRRAEGSLESVLRGGF